MGSSRPSTSPGADGGSPLHARFYADDAVFDTATVISNDLIAQQTWRIRCESPRIAGRIVPGQFVMLRIAGIWDPLLARPFALYDVQHSILGEPRFLDLVYQVVGKMTVALSRLQPGAQLEIIGPLGNGFPILPCDRMILVAGGIGQTPFLAVAQQALGKKVYGCQAVSPGCRQVDFCYGARNAEFFAGLRDFERAGVNLHLATDDGSRGRRGFVTEVLAEICDALPANEKTVVFCCGPEPMMAATAQICQVAGLSCWASLETPMACGIGACYTCVARIRDDAKGWDYKRTCVEGPVFAAEKIVW